MNRASLIRGLKKVGVSLNGWMPVLKCEACQRRWEPFAATDDAAAPAVRFDYWRCPNGCNAAAAVGSEVQTVHPRYLVINGTPGMVFGDEDLAEFKRYVRSMDATEIPDRAG